LEAPSRNSKKEENWGKREKCTKEHGKAVPRVVFIMLKVFTLLSVAFLAFPVISMPFKTHRRLVAQEEKAGTSQVER